MNEAKRAQARDGADLWWKVDETAAGRLRALSDAPRAVMLRDGCSVEVAIDAVCSALQARPALELFKLRAGYASRCGLEDLQPPRSRFSTAGRFGGQQLATDAGVELEGRIGPDGRFRPAASVARPVARPPMREVGLQQLRMAWRNNAMVYGRVAGQPGLRRQEWHACIAIRERQFVELFGEFEPVRAAAAAVADQCHASRGPVAKSPAERAQARLARDDAIRAAYPGLVREHGATKAQEELGTSHHLTSRSIREIVAKNGKKKPGKAVVDIATIKWTAPRAG